MLQAKLKIHKTITVTMNDYHGFTENWDPIIQKALELFPWLDEDDIEDDIQVERYNDEEIAAGEGRE